MKLFKPISFVIVGAAALFSVSCIDLVVSLGPWFDVETAVDEPRLRGSWCLDEVEGDCPPDERAKFVPGPGKSWNVLGAGQLRYRVWMGEIEGTRYLDWMFLCEPSRGAAEDDCLDLELPLGTHLLARIASQEQDRIEFRILDGAAFAELLALHGKPIGHAPLEGGTVVVEDSGALVALLAEHGERLDLWFEEPVVMTRVRRGR